ncbi:MAG: hypothetical protein OCC46_04420 [Pseudodesulfovibrio sp.]
MYPDGIDFKPYALKDEYFTEPNDVACTLNNRDLIACVSNC